MGEIVIAVLIGGAMAGVGLLMRARLVKEAEQNAED
jgi:hypothetical protein